MDNPYFPNHRQAIDALLKDFGNRCAYSQQHVNRAGGKTGMEVDHHNPHLLRKRERNHYDNLLPALRRCNLMKSDLPTSEDVKAGLRFLNPAVEQDYGTHLFEHPVTHELVSNTEIGLYHIVNCDLNEPTLIRARITRARWHKRLERVRLRAESPEALLDPNLPMLIEDFKRELDEMIPPIPYCEVAGIAENTPNRGTPAASTRSK